MSPTPFAIIAGVGPGTGASVARKFAASYPVVLLARSPSSYEPLVSEIVSGGGKAVGVSTDVTNAQSVTDAFASIGKEFGPEPKLAAAVFNLSGGFARKPFLELTQKEFDAGYEFNGKAAFLFSQAVLPLMLRSTDLTYPPSLIFTGATASVKGSAMFSSFAHGKWGVRALAQSLAREFGPQGVHVAHVIIDGVIDIPRTKGWLNDKEDAKISPEAIADAYWHLHSQPRTSFAFEMDLRPYIEKW